MLAANRSMLASKPQMPSDTICLAPLYPDISDSTIRAYANESV
jgi:hypothetical protein